MRLRSRSRCARWGAGLLAFAVAAFGETKFGPMLLSGTGDAITLPLGFLSDDGVTLVQFDVIFDPGALPLGAPIVGEDAPIHRLDSNLVAPGRRRVVLYSTLLTPLDGGVVARFPVPGAAAGAPAPTLGEIKLLTANGAAITLTSSDLKPIIAAGPDGTSPVEGQRRVLQASVTGLGPFTFQWLFNGLPIEGATGPELVIPSFGAANNGSYAVRITNGAGSVMTPPVALTLSTNLAPALVNPPLPQSVPWATTVTFTAGATGAAPLTYEWFFNDVAIAGATNAALDLGRVQRNRAGAYRVRVHNAHGEAASNNVALSVGLPTASIDTDGDGVPDLLVYGAGRDAFARQGAGLVSLSLVNKRLNLSFLRVADPGLIYEVQATNDLSQTSAWSAIWSSRGVENVAGPVTVVDTADAPVTGRRFLRLVVTAAP